MTREEAIDVLKAYLMFDKSSKQVAKALDMAIEALSAENVHIEVYRDLYEKYVDLKHASADAVQGEWTHDGSMWKNRWVCNKCGHKIFERQTNFCPNCGARMTPYKGGDDE